METLINYNKQTIFLLKRLLVQTASEIQSENQVLSKEEAADFLKVSIHTIERLAFRKNQIAYSKAGKKAVFLKRDLLEYLAHKRIPTVYEDGV